MLECFLEIGKAKLKYFPKNIKATFTARKKKAKIKAPWTELLKLYSMFLWEKKWYKQKLALYTNVTHNLSQTIQTTHNLFKLPLWF